jgi:hypothetical protein
MVDTSLLSKDARVTDMVSDPEALVDEKVAARILGLTNPRTLSVWRSTRRYPNLRHLKIGNAVRYRVADLLEFRDSSNQKG